MASARCASWASRLSAEITAARRSVRVSAARWLTDRNIEPSRGCALKHGCISVVTVNVRPRCYAGRMSEAFVQPQRDESASDAAVAAAIDVPMPHERPGVLRSEAAILLDRLLVARARKRGAVDVAIGEYLRMMAIGDRTLTFGYAGIGDYARERLGLNARTAQKMARLARELRARPLLREAVWSGEVTPRK